MLTEKVPLSKMQQGVDYFSLGKGEPQSLRRTSARDDVRDDADLISTSALQRSNNLCARG